MAELDITLDEWMQEMARIAAVAAAATGRPDGVFLSKELAAAAGRSIPWVRDRILKPALAAGRLEVLWIPQVDIVGIARRVPAFRIIR